MVTSSSQAKTQPVSRPYHEILGILKSGLPMKIEHLVLSLPEFTWKEIFSTIEQMKKEEIVTLYRQDFGIGIACVPHRLTGFLNNI